MKILNLTPHPITLVTNTQTLHFSREPIAARCWESQKSSVFNGLPIVEVQDTKVLDMPPPVEGVAYLVSRSVFDVLRDRKDILTPKDIIRDKYGKILGCTSFSKHA